MVRTDRKTRKNGKNLKDQRSWGYHLIINAGRCDPVALRSKTTITAFSKALVKKIDMVAFGAPRVVHFGESQTTGYTLVQLISTSCITAHFVEATNDIYLDIFSCKSFNKADAIAVFKEFFNPQTMQVIFMERQAKH